MHLIPNVFSSVNTSSFAAMKMPIYENVFQKWPKQGTDNPLSLNPLLQTFAGWVMTLERILIGKKALVEL